MAEFLASRGALVLEDGRIFRGEPFGAEVDAEGEAVFTTSMVGYQEIATDPSFYGQLVCLTYPLIGNYGVNAEDDQSRRPWVAGLIVREYCDEPSHWRATGTLAEYLRRHGIPALHSVDTRALTRHIRRHGAMRALLVSDRAGRSDEELIERARRAWTPGEHEVVSTVTTPEPQVIDGPGPHVVVLDCGLKAGIISSLKRRGARITVVPVTTPASEILALAPDGVVTSPGPGDPAQAEAAVETVQGILAAGVPFLGICLGHQLLARAIGAETRRLKFGHRGGNHPVKDLQTGAVRITSQNHGYYVDAASVPVDLGWRVSQVSLNDGTVEGLEHVSQPFFSIQYHPEGSPGPLDSQDVFDRFLDRVRAAGPKAEAPVTTGTRISGVQE
ncbi:glutamine-hydrolyzing carbamoyl-phosphate synthase small subunit [Sphaerobacter sp.]|uniref:glutamine-hydrolyzing carbamoyl-phosphate synthase small subunit n=1 Tax=Sphaerobacter sp. TaxID=2099654 RepID=UPI001D430D73|nr:glutamine-hydrolyzing carbamoyl-phosphate synthase small subunit [Sphaerobacter sp.]MBX5444008.1 glutamine-hydrolyzing carbamoyl-phosphate synthase small subunit [Sphaerobacter sp.]